MGHSSETCVQSEMRPNKPDAVNPAIARWLTIEDQLRRVTDLKRSACKAGVDREGVRCCSYFALCLRVSVVECRRFHHRGTEAQRVERSDNAGSCCQSESELAGDFGDMDVLIAEPDAGGNSR